MMTILRRTNETKIEDENAKPSRSRAVIGLAELLVKLDAGQADDIGTSRQHYVLGLHPLKIANEGCKIASLREHPNSLPNTNLQHRATASSRKTISEFGVSSASPGVICLAKHTPPASL
jgi:hypothetical protein